MKRLVCSLVVLATFALVAGCSASSDVPDAATAPSEPTPKHPAPHWVTTGIALAKTSESSGSGSSRQGSGASSAVNGSGASDSDNPALPPREQVVPLLTQAGLSDSQATCVYNGVAANPQVATDITTLLKALSAAQGPSGTTSSTNALAALSTLSPDTGKRLLVAIAPCLDSTTLFALLSTSGGGGGSIGLDSISALATKSGGKPLPTIPVLTASQITALVSGSLSAAQKTQLQQVLTGAAALNKGKLPGLDLDKLDLTKLSPDQYSLLLAALVNGLTTAQQGQLLSLAKVDLNKLNLKIDPAKLKPEELGQLLLLISPLLAASINPNGFGLPAGADPTQIYIPPGTDLSQLNPLLFLSRDDVVAAAAAQGGNPILTGCLYDKLRALRPVVLARFFSTSGDQLATAEVLLSAISCVVAPAG